jgi:hypothetical protein
MAIVYRVKEWDRHFENSRSREVEHCRHVCLPNRQDGLGLTAVLKESDGLAIFGFFILLVERLSQQRQPRGGWMAGDGVPNGRPWTTSDMSFLWRRPEEEVKRALEVLTSPEVGWIEAVDTKTIPSAVPVDTSCRSERQSKAIEGQRDGRTDRGTEGRKDRRTEGGVLGTYPFKERFVREAGKIAVRLFKSVTSADNEVKQAMNKGQDLVRVMAWLLVTEKDHAKGEVNLPHAYFRALWSKGAEPPDWALDKAKELLKGEPNGGDKEGAEAAQPQQGGS